VARSQLVLLAIQGRFQSRSHRSHNLLSNTVGLSYTSILFGRATRCGGHAKPSQIMSKSN
jgi:hypothetical protein